MTYGGNNLKCDVAVGGLRGYSVNKVQCNILDETMK